MRRREDFDPGADDRDHDASGGRGAGSVSRGGVRPKWIAAGIAGLLLLIFAIANFERVEVNFLFFTSQARLVTVIAVSAALGFLVGWFVGRPGWAERRAARRAERD